MQPRLRYCSIRMNSLGRHTDQLLYYGAFELAERTNTKREHTGAITLGDIHGRISMLSVECSKCDRK